MIRIVNYDKNDFYCWLWTSNGEQVLEEEKNFNEKIREKYNQCRLQLQAESWISQAENLQLPRWWYLQLFQEWFFLIIPQSNDVSNKGHKVFLRHLFYRFFWSIYDCNHAKFCKKIKCFWLCALDHELRTSFRYLHSTPPVYKQNYIRNNFRGYISLCMVHYN